MRLNGENYTSSSLEAHQIHNQDTQLYETLLRTVLWPAHSPHYERMITDLIKAYIPDTLWFQKYVFICKKKKKTLPFTTTFCQEEADVWL